MLKKIVYTGPLKRVSMAPDGFSKTGKEPFVHRGEPTEVFPEVAADLVGDGSGPWKYWPLEEAKPEPPEAVGAPAPAQPKSKRKSKSSKTEG